VPIQAVQRGHDRAVDRVLDRHAGEFGRTVADGVQRGGRAVDRQRLPVIAATLGNHAGVGHLQERGFGERPRGTEIRDAGHDQNPIGS